MSNVAVSRVMIFKMEEAARIEGLRISPVGIMGEENTRDPGFDLRSFASCAGGASRRSINADTV